MARLDDKVAVVFGAGPNIGGDHSALHGEGGGKGGGE